MKTEKRSYKTKLIIRQTALVLIDITLFIVSSFLSLWLRFEFNYGELAETDFLANVLKLIPLTAFLMVVCSYAFGLYHSLWRFAGEREMVHAVFACMMSVSVQTVLQFLFGLPVPRSFVFINFLSLTAMVLGVRLLYRVARSIKDNKSISKGEKSRTMIIGAGEAGATILRELMRSAKSKNNVICFVDDDPVKNGRYVHGVPIAGSTDDIVDLAIKHEIEDIIFAIPTANAAKRREILKKCQQTGCNLKTLPGIYQLVNGEVDVKKIRKVEIEDLLARDSIKTNIEEIVEYVNDRVVMVTGGGGSIGSELCRQIATHGPQKLIIFDIYENNAYAIEQELRRKHPHLDLVVLIGSVRDVKRVDAVFERYKPSIVFHAAAHKHVPLMETSPCESIKNNVFGTYNVAEAADKHCADTFILISTDKAVNPTNIMGASKRLCEMVICDFAKRSETKFACVRFGNVLGSNGSVIPLFKKQIEQGGPVTVTHKDIIRYFMTIPEAVSLVLQAGAYANNGEIFVLDMGEPVKIDDLARNMIKLSGFEPDVDIAIEYTGLRPGEKLYEELLMAEEGLGKTENDLIFIGKLEDIDREWFEEKLKALKTACNDNSSEIRSLVKELVPTYSPKSLV
ncbi:MAG: polysaccharide biosynthesis protein [Clostridia bacterium]|nr:polysaccharide biosynthesis protein [Clostridia bacterium]